MKKYLSSAGLSLVLWFVLVLFFSGCQTLKGAADGFKRDIQDISQWDSEFQEVLW